MNKKLLALLMILVAGTAFAQTAKDRYESMHNNGKIYVTVTVFAIIIVAFFVYMFMLDRKVSKLEKTLNNKQK